MLIIRQSFLIFYFCPPPPSRLPLVENEIKAADRMFNKDLRFLKQPDLIILTILQSDMRLKLGSESNFWGPN